jgi:permease
MISLKKGLFMNFIKIRNIFLIFMACSFLGWIYEVLVGIFETHVGYVNRGYLFGPYLPIYGFGGLMLIALLTKVRDKKTYIGSFPLSFISVFLITMFITTVIELFGSYFMEFLTGDWLWDYSNYFCNFEGRIALWSSVKFGIGGLIIIYIVEPLINLCIKRSGKTAIDVFSLVLAVIFLIDLSFRPFLGSNFLGK